MSISVLFAIAEMAPLVKVGGLGDVGGGLPKALAECGLDVRVAIPYYSSIETEAHKIGDAGPGALWESRVGDVPVYLVEHAPSFGRDDLYGYQDDLDRFYAFCEALAHGAELLGWQPDVLHLHDSHPGFLASIVANNPAHPWARCGRVATIHNAGFAGEFTSGFAERHDLVDVPETRSSLGLNIQHGDQVTTVSPTHAEELLAGEDIEGISDLLRAKADRFRGILNGIDTAEYDPATDAALVANFGAGNLVARVENKLALQRELGLNVDPDIPIIAMVTRLFRQKGIDFGAEALDDLLTSDAVQVAVLGQGDDENVAAVRALEERHPDSVAVRIAFDAPLGQRIYGGCDIFFMPSRYEPCGLGQMIAMRYGAPPVVRRTGGLADSVDQHDPARDVGTGFLFDDETAEGALAALHDALRGFDDKVVWRNLQRRAMSRDASWGPAAREYEAVYRDAIEMRAATAAGAQR